MDTVQELSAASSDPNRLASTAEVDEKGLRWVLTGNAETPDRVLLGKLLQELHQQVLRRAQDHVLVDLYDLRFMNSSCFKDFVTWLTSIQSLEPGRRYRVHFRSNPKTRWQRTGLHALASFAVDLVTFE